MLYTGFAVAQAPHCAVALGRQTVSPSGSQGRGGQTDQQSPHRATLTMRDHRNNLGAVHPRSLYCTCLIHIYFFHEYPYRYQAITAVFTIFYIDNKPLLGTNVETDRQRNRQSDTVCHNCSVLLPRIRKIIFKASLESIFQKHWKFPLVLLVRAQSFFYNVLHRHDNNNKHSLR